MRFGIVLLVAAACGRSGFDAIGDGATGDGATGDGATGDGAPIIDGSPNFDTDSDGLVDSIDNCRTFANSAQRNWDGDPHGDLCDRCPHLISTLDPDADGDGVGDACDPRPAMGGDQRLRWQGFYDLTEIAGWPIQSGTWSVIAGVLDQSDGGPGLNRIDTPEAFGSVQVSSRIEIVQALGSVVAEIGVCGGDIPPNQYYCCAINGVGVRANSQWSGSGGQISSPVSWTGSAAVGALIDMTELMTATTNQCTFTQGSVSVTASTPRGPVTPGAAMAYTSITRARYHYLFVVAVGP